MKLALEHALHARFLRGLERAGDHPAVTVGDESVSYAAAHELALSWAGALLNVTETKPVAVLTGRSIESYVGILACLYAGLPVVPLLTEFPVARTRHMLEAAGVAAVIVDQEGAAQLPRLDLSLPVLAPGTDGGTIPVQGALAEPRAVGPDDVAYVLFTSGSTGQPKGVRLTHGNMTHYFGLMDAWYDFTAEDVFSQAAGLNWDSAVSDLWCAWGAGAGLVSVLTPAYRDIPMFVRENGITVWFSAPSVIALVRRTGKLQPGAMPALRWTYFGGEALTCEDAAGWQAAAPGSAVVNVYGPTEMTITTHRHTWDPDTSPELGVNGVVPLGPVHPGHGERLIGPNGEPSPTEGELWVTGPQMSAGYVDPADGVGKYLHEEGRTWYRTGDRVRRAHTGELIYLGRVDSQVQVGGYRVELAEIDHALRGIDGVLDGVTVGAQVDNTAVLMAFYTGDRVSPAMFARKLADVLPQQMIPRHYRHVEQFPLNTNKKIDRLALTATAAELLKK
jgi:amino acid adenylation domain-containing protein